MKIRNLVITIRNKSIREAYVTIHTGLHFLSNIECLSDKLVNCCTGTALQSMKVFRVRVIDLNKVISSRRCTIQKLIVWRLQQNWSKATMKLNSSSPSIDTAWASVSSLLLLVALSWAGPLLQQPMSLFQFQLVYELSKLSWKHDELRRLSWNHETYLIKERMKTWRTKASWEVVELWILPAY